MNPRTLKEIEKNLLATVSRDLVKREAINNIKAICKKFPQLDPQTITSKGFKKGIFT